MESDLFREIIRNSSFAWSYLKLVEKGENGSGKSGTVSGGLGVERDFIMLDVNPAFERWSGRKATDLIDRRISEVMPDPGRDGGDGKNWLDHFSEIALAGGSKEVEGFFLPFGRHVRVLIQSDCPGFFSAMFVDLESNHRKMDDLQEESRLLNEMINNIPDVLSVQYPDYTIRNYNKAGYEMLGLGPDEVSGKTCYELIGRDRVCDDCATQRALASKKSERAERYLPHLDIYLDCYSCPIFDEQGNVVYIIEQLRDVTRQRKAEAERKKSKKHLERQYAFSRALNRIFDIMIKEEEPDRILDGLVQVMGQTLGVDRALVYDIRFDDEVAEGLCEWLNPDHPEITPTKDTYPLHYFIAGTSWMLKTGHWLVSHHDAPHPEIKAGSDKLLHGEMGIKSLIWYPFAFRESGYFLLVLNQVQQRRQWTEDELSFFEVATRQISLALQKLDWLAQNRKAEKQIRASLTEKEVLLSEIHHRVKNNMAVISSLLTLQSEFEVSKKEPKELLRDIQHRIKSMALVHEMVYETENYAEINFGALLKRMMENLEDIHRSPDKKIQISLETDDVMLTISQSVPLSILVNEVIMNAYKHAFAGKKQGRIRVMIKNKEGGYQLTVEDDGVGVADLGVLQNPDSYGSTIIHGLLAQLRGEVTFTSPLDSLAREVPEFGAGLRVEMNFQMV